MMGMGAYTLLQSAGYDEKGAQQAFLKPAEEKLIRPGLMQTVELSEHATRLSKFAAPFLLAGGLAFYSFRIYNLYRVARPATGTTGIMAQARARLMPNRNGTTPGVSFAEPHADPRANFEQA